MALNLSKDYTFAPNTVIASSEVNTDLDELYNAFTGLEATTSTLAKLKMDADPAAALEVATKQYVDAYANYKRPNLVYVSATTVDVADNTGTANQTKIVFPDGNYRTVTEDTGSSTKYRRFDITADAEFTSGTEESGLRAALSEATNTWYAIYAVKSLINTANFVLVGDTTLPVQASVSTLNGFYGTNGWVYLGMIRNGDNSGATGDILNFYQSGCTTMFLNAATAEAASIGTIQGTRLATTTGGATLVYTFSAGTGAANIPGHIFFVYWGVPVDGVADALEIMDSARTYGLKFYRSDGAAATCDLIWGVASKGCSIRANAEANTPDADIFLAGYIDSVLGVGSNPFI